MIHLRRSLACSMAGLAFVLGLGGDVLGENWPQWRGPRGTGVSGERGLPIVWSEKRGLVWKTELPEWGDSSPCVFGEAIFLTAQSDDKLLLIKVNKITGAVEWTREVGKAQTPREADKRSVQKFHQLHNLATPTPATDGKTVVVHFGNGDLAAYDFSGERIWKRNLADDYGPYTIWWGHANSPVIGQGQVLSVCMQDSLADLREKPAPSYLVAHDLRDGHEKWKTLRNTGAAAESCDSYTTPLLLPKGENGWQAVVMGGNQLDAYDVLTGKQLWALPDLPGGRTVTGPTAQGDMVFCTQGMRKSLLAVRIDQAEGKLDRNRIAWKYDQGTPDSSSGVVWERHLFVVTDDGFASCFDIEKGGQRWKQRLGGDYKASPVASEGRIFFLSTKGKCTVISATPEYNKLVENQLDDDTIASPAISDGRIILRGRKYLYCIGR